MRKVLMFLFLLVILQIINGYSKETLLKQIQDKNIQLKKTMELIRQQTKEIQKIIRIESSNNPKAKSYVNAIGLMQIMKPVIIEYNQRHKTQYTLNDLFNAKINIKIGKWYWNIRIPQMLKYYKIPITIDNKIISYNYGIGNCIKYYKGKIKLPLETKNYIKKFNALKL